MRRSSPLALAALLVAFPLLASCATLTPVAGSTPSAAGKSQTAAAGTSRGACVRGSTSEPITTFMPVKMVSATAGWAIGQCGLPARPSFPNGSTIQCFWPDSDFDGVLRTTDGGRTWTDVSPPSLPNRSFQQAKYFLDAQHAWIAEVTRTADACVSSLTTFSTADGGRTWTRGGTIPIKSEAPTSGLFDVPGPTNSMDFIDQQHGWLLLNASAANPQPGAMSDPTSLYSTQDGGVHWKLVATNPGKSLQGGTSGCSTDFYAPVSDPIFTSAASGWFAISCTSQVGIVHTNDGGATWTLRTLPCSCQVWIPQAFDADHAVVTGQQGSPVMLSTADGGATWAQLKVPSAASTYFFFIDPNDGWMAGIEQLARSYDTVVYRTTDGGRSWSLVSKQGFATSTSKPNLYFPIQALQFVDAATGFVTLGAEAGAQGGPVVNDPMAPQLQVLTTSDGGHTWSTIVKQVPAAACSADYAQIGFGSGALSPVKMASPTVGWASGGLRTTDGGVHWRDVSSPDMREGSATQLYPPGFTDFYLDGDHAWQAAAYGSSTTCFDHVSVFSTTDGGTTWRRSAPIALHLPSGDMPGALQIGFTSHLVGWLWIPEGQASPDRLDFYPTQADLYATPDGGATWRHVSHLDKSLLQPAPTSDNCPTAFGRIEYLSPTAGWMSPRCADSPMLVTGDGGATWKPASFPIPSSAGCPCYLQSMQFEDVTHGIAVFSGNSGLSGSTVILATSNSGASWQALPQPGTGFLLQLSIVDPNDLFALVTPPGWTKLSKAGFELHRSTDGGHSWTMVQPAVPGTWPPGFMDFVDLDHGFESNVNGADVLLVTSDGGKTWRSITPSIVS